ERKDAHHAPAAQGLCRVSCILFRARLAVHGCADALCLPGASTRSPGASSAPAQQHSSCNSFDRPRKRDRRSDHLRPNEAIGAERKDTPVAQKEGKKLTWLKPLPRR